MDSGRIYYPILLEEEHYTSGLVVTHDAPTEGYFSFINGSRRPSNVAYFDVADSLDMNKVSMEAVFEHDSLGCYLLTYYPRSENDSWSGFLTKINQTEGLIWHKEIKLEREPEALSIAMEEEELIVTYKNLSPVEDHSKVLAIDIGADLQNWFYRTIFFQSEYRISILLEIFS